MEQFPAACDCTITGLHVPRRGLARRVARPALERPPAEVRALAPAAAHVVDLLPRALADVADGERAVRAVEGEAPRVAQAVGVDLAARARRGRRTGCSRARVYGLAAGRRRLDAQDLAEQRAEVLRVAARAVPVAAAAAVARADVEQAVGPEGELAAVVVGLAVGHPQDEPRGAGVGPVGARGLVLDDALVARAVRVVDVEQRPTPCSPRRRPSRAGPARRRLRHEVADVEERPVQRPRRRG